MKKTTKTGSKTMVPNGETLTERANRLGVELTERVGDTAICKNCDTETPLSEILAALSAYSGHVDATVSFYHGSSELVEVNVCYTRAKLAARLEQDCRNVEVTRRKLAKRETTAIVAERAELARLRAKYGE